MHTIPYVGPKRFAHRGLQQAGPENTLDAFAGALRVGAEGIEIDIRKSKDGKVVVIHDENLSRLTLGHPSRQSHMPVSELTWEQLAQVELPYANHLLDTELPRDSWNEVLATRLERQLGQEAGRGYYEAMQAEPRMAKLMRLEEFLEWLEGCERPIMAEIEIKAAGLAALAGNMLRKSAAADRCILFSGHPAYIAELQEYGKAELRPGELKLGANIRRLTEQAKALLRRMELFEVGLDAGAFTQGDVEYLRERGIQVFANLGDCEKWWAEYCSFEIYAFKTNYFEAFTGWWQQKYAAMPENAAYPCTTPEE